MLLTTQNIGSIVGATKLENSFIQWIDRQSMADNAPFTIENGNRAFIGDVSYTLLSNGVIRGRCPVIGTFLAARLTID